MLFNSWEFLLLFLPCVLAGYFGLQRLGLPRAAQCFLLLASWFFIAYWNVACLLLLLISLGMNFAATQLLQREAWQSPEARFDRARHCMLVLGVAGNLLLLGYFKYMDFFIATAQQVTGQHWDVFHIALPLAVSFYTLQQIGLLLDTYEKLVKNRNLLQHALFVSFFPYLISGPIARFREIMPQFADSSLRAVQPGNLAKGLFLLSLGLCKKVVLADSLALYVNEGFGHASALSCLEAWFTALAFTFQMYFDFSGYSDMAIGIALLFNIRLPANFNSPLRATSLIQFWNGWHMTLTRFINAYVYTPLVRRFSTRAPRGISFAGAMGATWLAMLVSGLWHGANVTYIAWGALHGSALVINHLWRRRKWPLPRPLGWLCTVLFVTLALVLFRAESLQQAQQLLCAMAGMSGSAAADLSERLLMQTGLAALPLLPAALPSAVVCACALLLCLLLVLLPRNSMHWRDSFTPSWRFALLNIVCLSAVLLLLTGDDSGFIYFRF